MGSKSCLGPVNATTIEIELIMINIIILNLVILSVMRQSQKAWRPKELVDERIKWVMSVLFQVSAAYFHLWDTMSLISSYII